MNTIDELEGAVMRLQDSLEALLRRYNELSQAAAEDSLSGAVIQAQHMPTYRLVICVSCHTTSPLLMTDWRCDFALAGS